MNDFIPTTVYYQQPVSCSLCPSITIEGIKEYDEKGTPKERALCKHCLLVLLREYKQYFALRYFRQDPSLTSLLV